VPEHVHLWFVSYTISDAVPTEFSFPEHFKKVTKPLRRSPAYRGSSTPSAQDTAAMTSTSTGNAAAIEHQYAISSPSVVRKRLLHTADELSSCRKRLKMSLQQTRRLRSKIISMQSLLTDLQNKKMLSQQAADTISSSFSGPAMELVKRCINKGSGTYPPELKAFALTLQF